ncbi:MAG: hypothetical protein KIH01_00395 [Candidatus Freyarchaeota archaeon]|nr:hypothetical protein [Candidatus Jordarchaeia archaeon]
MLSTVIVLLLVEAVYAAFFSFTTYALLSSVEVVRGTALTLLGIAPSSPGTELTLLVYFSVSSLLPLYTSQITFSIGLMAFNLLLAWRVTSPWRYNYHVILTQLTVVVVVSLLVMPETVGAFFIAVSILLFVASQSREIKGSCP